MKTLKELVEQAQMLLGYFYDDEGNLYTYDDFASIEERLVRTRVVRKGRRVIKWKTDRPGYKVAFVSGRPKEVRIKPAERIKRKKGQKAGKRKRVAKKSQAAIRRKRSLRLVRR